MLYDLIDESGDVLDTRCFDPNDLPTFQAAAKASLGQGASWTPSGAAPAEDAGGHVSNCKPGASPQT